MEGLSDDHHSKPQCLFNLSDLFGSLGNHAERKRLLTHALELERGRGNDNRVARTLTKLGDTNRLLRLYEEGIRQSKEALEIYERLGDAEGQGKCWNNLGWLFLGDGQLDAAEEAGSHAIKLFLDEGREYWVCRTHRLLGEIYRSKREIKKAVEHFEAAIGIASPFDWHDQLFWTHFALAVLFCNEDEFDNAQSHIERAKSHTIDDALELGCAMDQQATIWYHQGRLEDGKAEVLRAIETFEKLGATADLSVSRNILRKIERAIERQ